MDSIPVEAFKHSTMLDRLDQGDTLFIDAYIASAEEFGGYDEGFWIWKDGDVYSGRFFSLANSYELGWEEDIIGFYKTFQYKSKPKAESFIINGIQLTALNKFLVETKNYNGQPWMISNAPERIAVYTKHESYQILHHDHNWRPYLKLKDEIAP